MSFSENLRAELNYRDITLKELSFRTNIPYSTLLSYVQKKASLPNIEMGYKIAKALDVSVEYLVAGEDAVTRQFSSKDLLSKITKAFDALEKINSLLREALSCILSCR